MQIDPVVYEDFSGGQANNINPSLVPQSCCDLLLNMDCDEEIGSAVSRLGTAAVGSQLGGAATNILGLVQHVDQADSTKNKLFAALVNSGQNKIYDVTAGTASLTGDTSGLKTRFLNLNGDTLRLNGTDAPKAYDSTSWITSGGVFDLANMPTGYKYPLEFLDRVYLWGNASTPYRFAYSGVLTSGTVSWTSGNDTVDLEPEDNGGAATGIGKVPGYVLFFKERSMHRWDFNSASPESLVNIGAASQESIVMGGGLCAFYCASNENEKGFYVTNGGRPTRISHDTTRPINKWVDAITSDTAVAGWATNRGFAWSVGDLTIDGESFANVVLRYNRVLDQWTVRSYPSEFKVFCPYITSGVNTIVGGDDNATIYRVDKTGSYSDNGTAIRYRIRTRHDDFGTSRLKTLAEQAIVRGKGIEGAAINVIPNEDVSASVPLQPYNLVRRLLSFFKIGQTAQGTTLSIEVTGETSGARTYIRKIELPAIDVAENFAV